MGIDHFGKARHALHTGVGGLEMENQHFTSVLSKRLDHRIARELASAIIVCLHMAHDFCRLIRTRKVHRENRNAGLVRLANGGADVFAAARTHDDRFDLLRDEIVDLLVLCLRLVSAIDHHHLIAVLGGLGFQCVADNVKKRVG